MLHLCLIKLPDGSGRVVKAGEQISADIVDFLRTLTQAVKHILDMRFVQLPKAGTYRLDRNFLPPYLDSGLGRSQNIGNQVRNPFHVLPAVFLRKLVKTNIFHHLLAKNLLTAEATAFLESAYGDLNEYLQSRIEAEVRNQKHDVGALVLEK